MRILVILLFVSFNSFGQTYEDIMSIKDIDSFKKVCIENNYEYMSAQMLIELGKKQGEELNEDTVIKWMKDVTMYIKENGSMRGIYYTGTALDIIGVNDDSFSFQIVRKNLLGFEIDNLYDNLLKDVKDNCEYYKIIISPNGHEYASYSCEDAQFEGKLGFRIIEDEGLMWLFPNE